MNLDRTARALHHLTLALAGVTLTLAELPFIPWLPFGLIVYLVLILVAHSLRGRFLLPEWAANLLAVLIATTAGIYIFLRSGADLWADDVPLPAALVPYLGPVLMALLCVRLFRPRSTDDFWLLQGLALLQVGLGCILASGTLFALALLLYLVVAGAALAAGERYRRGKRSAWVSGPPVLPTAWLPLGLRWVVGVALLAIPLFLLSPRSDQPDWDPLAGFGVRAQRKESRTGFSDELDLRRTGRLVPDETIAFTVQTRDGQGRRRDLLPADALFRGSVLDRYENSTWRVEATMTGIFAGDPKPEFLDLGSEAIEIRFLVPRRTHGLFLLDPLPLSSDKKRLPVRLIGETALKGPITQNVEVYPTPRPTAFLNLPGYRYAQYVKKDRSLDRTRAPRYRESYLLRLVRCPVPDLELLARGMLLASPFTTPELRQALQTNEPELPPRWWEAMARALKEHLARSGEFRYSLESQRSDLELDPTLDFLNNVRAGPCDRYASALALLLRSLGIPARIVKGYRGVERQREGEYIVRQSHAHAWVEALVPADDGSAEYDWLTLDPTPEAASSISDLARWLERTQSGGQEFFRELVVNYNARSRAAVLERLQSSDTWLYLSPWLVGAVLVLLALWLVRQRRRALVAPAIQGIQGLYGRLLTLLAARGWRAEPHGTPQELAQQARHWLRQHSMTAWEQLPIQLARLLYQVRYGRQRVAANELRLLAEQLDRLEADLRSQGLSASKSRA